MSPLKFLQLFKEAWRNRESLGVDRRYSEQAFLPAALEVQETPPHPLARWVGITLMSLFVIGIIWACVGKVDVMATAEGKIIPSSRIKTIQPLDKGVIQAIYVKEGQKVNEGDLLVALDKTITGAEKKRLSYALSTSHIEKQRTQKFIDAIINQLPPEALISLEDSLNNGLQLTEGELLYQQQLLSQQWQQYQSQLATLASNKTAKLAELDTTQAQIEKLQQTLPIISDRANNLKGLSEKQHATEDQYLLAEQERIETYQNLISQRAQLRQLTASLEAIKQQEQGLIAEQLTNSYQTLSGAQQQINSLTEELNKATDLNAKQMLYAPVDGVIQELKISTIGGVVMEAETLMTLVPMDEKLEVQAFLKNKDIGYVEEGMAAEVKIHTFPFTKYGVIDASVKSITDDAVEPQNIQEDLGVQNSAGLVFAMHLLLDKSTIWVNGNDFRLIPGMTVTAEVKIDERTIIDFLLTPIKKGFAESLRER